MKGLHYIVFSIIVSIMFSASVLAETCTYQTSNGQYGDLEFVCNVTENSLNCDFKYGNNIRKEAVDYSNLKRGLTYEDFFNEEGEVDCGEVPNLFFDQYTDYNSKIVIFNYDHSRTDNCTIHTTISQDKIMPGTYSEDCTLYTLVNNNENNGNSGNGVSGEELPESTAGDKGEEILSNFCTAEVLGAFTTLGWVIFFIKIVVPIIIIVLGSIDLGKAVVASKDDEIKKSVKSLIIRVIAGIIIFFVPTILSFIIQLVSGSTNDDPIYNVGSGYAGDGSFADCTYCLLNPSGENCRKLHE